MPLVAEQRFECPYCGETVSCVLDLSMGGQRYVEDCEVCCQPIDIDYAVEDDRVARFTVRRLDA